MRNTDASFMDYIQLHERVWGNKMYSGRPKLAAILDPPVVVFWRSNENPDVWTITLHSDLKDVEAVMLKMLFRSSVNPPTKRPFRIFRNRKRMIIRSIHVIFAEADE